MWLVATLMHSDMNQLQVNYSLLKFTSGFQKGRKLMVLLAHNVRGKSLYPGKNSGYSVARNIRICGQDEPNSIMVL